MPRIFTIEGNIGSGKSTFVQKLGEQTDGETIIFLQEPVKTWQGIQDTNGVSILQKFYEDQERYGFTFQMMAYISRLALLKETVEKNPHANIITERSLFTDRYVFAQMLYDSGKIQDIEYTIYLKWFDTFVREYPIYGVIYLRTSPEICFQRVEKRARSGESTVSLEYLTMCNNYHEKWLKNEKHMCTLNASSNIYEEGVFDDWFGKVVKFIHTVPNRRGNPAPQYASKYHYTNCI